MGRCRPGFLRGFTTAWSTSQAQTRSASARLPTTSWSWSPPHQQRRSTPATTSIAQRLTDGDRISSSTRTTGHTPASLNGVRRAGRDVSGLAPWRTPTLTVHSIRKRRCQTFSSFPPARAAVRTPISPTDLHEHMGMPGREGRPRQPQSPALRPPERSDTQRRGIFELLTLVDEG
jgi:hypothetical protein